MKKEYIIQIECQIDEAKKISSYCINHLEEAQIHIVPRDNEEKEQEEETFNQLRSFYLWLEKQDYVQPRNTYLLIQQYLEETQ